MLSSNTSNAAIPSGLRRTRDGWEDASLWSVAPGYRSRSIEDWIDHQRRTEPGWARGTFEQLRQTPPLMIAVIQIAAIAAIFYLSRNATPSPN